MSNERYNPFTEVALGKCEKCRDQLLSIPGRTPEQPRRIICPICTVNELDEMRQLVERREYGPDVDL